MLANLLLVTYQAMKTSGHSWPVISEQTQERSLQRMTGTIRFIEDGTPDLHQQCVAQQMSEHDESDLLTFVY